MEADTESGRAIQFDRLGPELLKRFPACQAIASHDSFLELEGPDADGAYIIFSALVHPHLEALVAGNDMDEIKSMMDFIELLANQQDQRWPELVQIEFGEWVYGYADKAILEKFAGPETRKAIWNAERYFIRGQRQNQSSPLADFFRRLLLPKRKG